MPLSHLIFPSFPAQDGTLLFSALACGDSAHGCGPWREMVATTLIPYNGPLNREAPYDVIAMEVAAPLDRPTW